ncbi:MAG: heme b synthase [Deltaproteobacteria bacterium]|nr:heme b synthase [Deltaproteobacteria bacterium]
MKNSLVLPATLRMVAWEVTRSCNLSCLHCRASSQHGPYAGELDTAQCFRLLDQIAEFADPVIILTGGEPMLRGDIYDIAAYGTKKGLRMVLATNGTMVAEEIARKMMASGIQRVSVSIDGKDAKSHDAFRGVPGAFDGSFNGIDAMKKAGLEFQINTTVTRLNLEQLPDILEMAVVSGAAAHHIFLLVPTGRGREMAEQAISAQDYEDTLNWFYDVSMDCPIQLKATCAPHFMRIFHQRGGARAAKAAAHPHGEGGPLHAMTRGCLGGSSFCFISHTGQVQPCGYLEIDCGQIKEKDFREIWEQSPDFLKLRDLKNYGGKCGVCEFLKVCGGCRARAYEATGDYLAEEPLCIYEPKRKVREQAK